MLLVFKLWCGAGPGSAQLTTLAATHVACIPHIARARDCRNALQLPDTGSAEGLLDRHENDNSSNNVDDDKDDRTVFKFERVIERWVVQSLRARFVQLNEKI